MFWGVLLIIELIGIWVFCIWLADWVGMSSFVGAVFAILLTREWAIGVGIGVATGTVIFLIGAAVVSAMDYMRKRNAS